MVVNICWEKHIVTEFAYWRVNTEFASACFRIRSLCVTLETRSFHIPLDHFFSRSDLTISWFDWAFPLQFQIFVSFDFSRSKKSIFKLSEPNFDDLHGARGRMCAFNAIIRSINVNIWLRLAYNFMPKNLWTIWACIPQNVCEYISHFLCVDGCLWVWNFRNGSFFD